MNGSIVKADANMRARMMELWKETFHDSDAYVNMFFNNCFSPDYTLAYVENDRVEAMLFGVPFTFHGFGGVTDDYVRFTNLRDNEAEILASGLQGMYLCGLATDPKFRHRGIMSRLIEQINEIATCDGFDFTFLIPADEGLFDYYADRKYVKSIFRTVNRFASDHDFLSVKSVDKISREKIDILQSKDTASYDSKLMYKVYDLVIESEKRMPWMTATHTVKEIDMIFEDARNSGGRMFYTMDSDDVLTAVTFTFPNDDKEVVVPHVFYRDNESLRALLAGVKNAYADRELVVYSFPEMSHRVALWYPFFEARDVVASADKTEDGSVDERAEINATIWDAADHSEAYGMVRLLRNDNVINLIESVSDMLFSAKTLVVKSDDKEDEKLRNQVVDKLQPYAQTDIRNKCGELSLQRLSEILFRRSSREDYVGMAYGLPRLPLNMAFMFD